MKVLKLNKFIFKEVKLKFPNIKQKHNELDYSLSVVCLNKNLIESVILVDKNSNMELHYNSLKSILLCFCKFLSMFTSIKISMNKECYKFFNIIQKLSCGLEITVLEENKNLYKVDNCSDNIHFQEFNDICGMRTRKKNNFKFHNVLFQTYFYCYSSEVLNIYVKDLLNYLINYFSVETLEANTNKILKILHERNINYLRVLNNNAKLLIIKKRDFGIRNRKQKEKYIEKLIANGYKIGSDFMSKNLIPSVKLNRNFEKYNKIIFKDNSFSFFYWTKIIEVNSFYSNDNFTYYRKIFEYMNKLNKNKYTYTVILLDSKNQYFISHSDLYNISKNIYEIIHRNFKSVYQSHLNRLKNKMILKELYPSENDSFYNNMSRLMNKVELNDLLKFINHNIKVQNDFSSFFKLLNNNLLTNGAINTIVKNEKALEQIGYFTCYLNYFECFDKKYLRKIVSTYIKRKEDLSKSTIPIYIECMKFSYKENLDEDFFNKFMEFHICNNVPFIIFNSFIKYLDLLDSEKHKNNDKFTFKLYKKYIQIFFNTNYEIYDSFFYSLPIAIYSKYGEEVAMKCSDRLIKIFITPDIKRTNQIHDICYVLKEILDLDYLTADSYSVILDKSYAKISSIHKNLISLKFNDVIKLEIDSINEINQIIELNGDISNTVSTIRKELEMKYLARLNIPNSDMSLYNTYIDRMRKYSEYISIVDLLTTFKEYTYDFVLGKYKGYFEEKKYYIKNDTLVDLIKQLLGKRGEGSIIKNPSKFYKSISQIKDVQQILNGYFTTTEKEKIIHEIKQRNVKINKEDYIHDLFMGYIEPKCSPEYLIAGDASVCCMSFKQRKAITYALEKGFGIYNIYYKNRIIANSVLWVNDDFNCLVIDNIEVHPNYINYNNYISELFKIMIKDVLIQYKLDFAVQGSQYNDLLLVDSRSKRYRLTMKAREVSSDFYSDAELAYIVDSGSIQNIEKVFSDFNVSTTNPNVEYNYGF